jgi:hypothetical protein
MADQNSGDGGQGFAGRWSRRKHAARAAGSEEVREEAAAPDAPAPAEPEPAAELPSIDDLDETSDYTPFLAREVPVELRRQALRKLWRSSPALANLDGLNDYDLDFKGLGAGKLVRTVFEAGKALARKVAAADAQSPQTPPKPAETDPEDGGGTPTGSG